MSKTIYICQLILGIILLSFFLFSTILEGTYSFVEFRNQGVLENYLIFANINDTEIGFTWDVDKFIFMLGDSWKPYVCIFILIYLIVLSFIFIKGKKKIKNSTK
jgi:hypothetical protein